MERVTFQNSRGLNLVGNFHPADSDAVIIMCHGFLGDKSELGRFDKAAQAFNDEGYNVLAFDFSGSGESDDDAITVDKEVDDLKHAIKFAESKGLHRIALLGLSLGGLVSLKTYSRKIITILLWAPVTNEIQTLHNIWPPEQLKELKDNGYIVKVKEQGIRKKIVVDRKMLEENHKIDQESLLSRIKCPVLIIHGSKDDIVPLKHSEAGIRFLPKDSRLVIIQEADHFFMKQLDTFIEHSVGWFRKELPAK